MSNINGDSSSCILGALGSVFFLWIKSCVCLLHHCVSEVLKSCRSALSYKLMTVESVNSSDVLLSVLMGPGLVGYDLGTEDGHVSIYST